MVIYYESRSVHNRLGTMSNVGQITFRKYTQVPKLTQMNDTEQPSASKETLIVCWRRLSSGDKAVSISWGISGVSRRKIGGKLRRHFHRVSQISI